MTMILTLLLEELASILSGAGGVFDPDSEGENAEALVGVVAVAVAVRIAPVEVFELNMMAQATNAGVHRPPAGTHTQPQ